MRGTNWLREEISNHGAIHKEQLKIPASFGSNAATVWRRVLAV